jgi:ABC-type multidrug transport system ATPase subunit
MLNQLGDMDLSWEIISEKLKNKNKVIIGRSSQCDIIVNDFYVSRKHIEIEFSNGDYYLKDLGSTNKTYLNDKIVNQKVKLKDRDKIIFGKHLVIVGGIGIDLAKNYCVELDNVTVFLNGKRILNSLNLNIDSGEMLAIMGPSGSGKSTLLKSIINIIKPQEGKVKIFGLDFKNNRKYLSSKIGYVPQHDILHKNLKVYESLYLTGKIKLGDVLNEQELKRRVYESLSSVGLWNENIINNLVCNLSGGQLKRLCIAAALLSDPDILLLDEPTSPLDPETIHEFMKYLIKLKEQGKTIIMVTHKPDDIVFFDRVLFLSTGGYPVYLGKPDEINFFFKCSNINEVYRLFSDDSIGKSHQLIVTSKNVISEMSENSRLDNGFNTTQKTEIKNLLNQFIWLIGRNFTIKYRTKNYFLINILQSVLLGMLVMFSYSKFTIIVILMLVLSVIWIGVSLASREIVDEREILSFEKLFNLNLHIYLLSKFFTLGIILFFETIIFFFLVYYQYSNNDIKIGNFTNYYFILLLIGIISIGLGLLISSYFSTPDKVMSILPLMLIPQILFSGVVSPLDSYSKQFLSIFSVSRWGIELLVREQSNYEFSENNDYLIFNPKYDTVYKYIYPYKNLPCICYSNLKNKYLKLPEKINVTYNKMYINSKYNIYCLNPVIAKDTLKVKDNADTIPYLTSKSEYKYGDIEKEINLYNEYSIFSKYTNSNNKNVAVLTIMLIVFYILSYYQLKKI